MLRREGSDAAASHASRLLPPRLPAQDRRRRRPPEDPARCWSPRARGPRWCPCRSSHRSLWGPRTVRLGVVAFVDRVLVVFVHVVVSAIDLAEHVVDRRFHVLLGHALLRELLVADIDVARLRQLLLGHLARPRELHVPGLPAHWTEELRGGRVEILSELDVDRTVPAFHAMPRRAWPCDPLRRRLLAAVLPYGLVPQPLLVPRRPVAAVDHAAPPARLPCGEELLAERFVDPPAVDRDQPGLVRDAVQRRRMRVDHRLVEAERAPRALADDAVRAQLLIALEALDTSHGAPRVGSRARVDRARQLVVVPLLELTDHGSLQLDN